MSDVTASEAPGVADVRESAGATVAPDAATTSGMGKTPRMARSFVATEDAGTRGAVRARGAEKAPDMAGAPDVARAAAMPTLILFTRVPRAGQAKTRLIPALGEHGAAEFQWRLLARLLGELRHGAEQGLWRLRVYYCGT